MTAPLYDTGIRCPKCGSADFYLYHYPPEKLRCNKCKYEDEAKNWVMGEPRTPTTEILRVSNEAKTTHN